MLGVAALAGFLQQDFKLSAAETGLLITASYAAPTVSLLFVGDLLDRKSERAIIGVGAAIGGGALLLAATSGSFIMLLFWLFVVGLGYSTTQPGGSKSVSAWFRGERLGLAMGIRQAGLPFGGAVAAAILPALAAAWSWRAAFIAGAASALGGGLAFALIYRAPPEAADAGPRRTGLTVASVAALLRQSWMRNAMIAGLALVSAQYGILTWLMLYLRDHAHIPLTHGAFYLALAQAAGVAGRIGLAAWSDRVPGARFRLLTASMIAVAAGVLLLAFVPAANAGAGARRACRVARFLRARLVRTMGRISCRNGGGGPSRAHARRRHGDQSARHHRRAAAAWPRSRLKRRLRRAVGRHRSGTGRCLRADGTDAPSMTGNGDPPRHLQNRKITLFPARPCLKRLFEFQSGV